MQESKLPKLTNAYPSIHQHKLYQTLAPKFN